MSLPKLYSPIILKFWSLRNGLGSNGGVICDIDTEVERKCMRVRCEGGWKWQIIDFNKIIQWDYSAETDKLCLDEMSMGKVEKVGRKNFAQVL